MIVVVWLQRRHWELVWWVVHFGPIAGWVLALRPEVRNGQGLVRMSFHTSFVRRFFSYRQQSQQHKELPCFEWCRPWQIILTKFLAFFWHSDIYTDVSDILYILTYIYRACDMARVHWCPQWRRAGGRRRKEWRSREGKKEGRRKGGKEWARQGRRSCTFVKI